MNHSILGQAFCSLYLCSFLYINFYIFILFYCFDYKHIHYCDQPSPSHNPEVKPSKNGWKRIESLRPGGLVAHKDILSTWSPFEEESYSSPLPSHWGESGQVWEILYPGNFPGGHLVHVAPGVDPDYRFACCGHAYSPLCGMPIWSFPHRNSHTNSWVSVPLQLSYSYHNVEACISVHIFTLHLDDPWVILFSCI